VKHAWVQISLAAFVLAAATGVWFWNINRIPRLDFGPVPSGAQALKQSDIEQLLTARFTVVRRVRQIPAPLKESFSNVTGLPFDMNNPGDMMSTDVIIQAPSRQLIFAAIGKQSAIVVYEQGSFASFPCAVVVSKSGAVAWIAIDDYQPTDISALRRSVHEARFKPMRPSM
jgi:hypothetical protein